MLDNVGSIESGRQFSGDVFFCDGSQIGPVPVQDVTQRVTVTLSRTANKLLDRGIVLIHRPIVRYLTVTIRPEVRRVFFKDYRKRRKEA